MDQRYTTESLVQRKYDASKNISTHGSEECNLNYSWMIVESIAVEVVYKMQILISVQITQYYFRQITTSLHYETSTYLPNACWTWNYVDTDTSNILDSLPETGDQACH